MSKRYPAKLLLFGEYAIIRGSQALIIPYDRYTGSLLTHGKTHQSIRDLHQYCVDHRFDWLDTDQRAHDIQNQKLSYNSTIPMSYGIGSSGALVAAIYDRYRTITDHTIEIIHHHLSQMEARFHGHSSGMDPLTSYLDQVIHKSEDEIRVIDHLAVPHFELIDTHQPGTTKTNIERFQKKLTDPAFVSSFNKWFVTHTNSTIQSLLSQDSESFQSSLQTLSQRTLDNLSYLIPKGYHDYRQKGLDTKKYYCKLCGSGGGGFILSYKLNA